MLYGHEAKAALADGTALRLLAQSEIPTDHGPFSAIVFARGDRELDDVALLRGEMEDGEDLLVRLHSECLTGEVFGSYRCDCGDQLKRSMEIIGEKGRGLIIYLRQEGRGIGLGNKIRAYELQDRGLDTVDANRCLGFRDDERDYTLAAEILHLLGVKSLRLLTNNPKKIAGLTACGLQVIERLSLVIPPNIYNAKYLRVKRERSGHLLPRDPR